MSAFSKMAIAKRYFPQAKIVADRFHVIRELDHQCMQVYQKLEPAIKNHRGLFAILRTKPENPSEKKRIKRNEFKKKHPAIEVIYPFKQQLHQLLMHKNKQKMNVENLFFSSSSVLNN